MLVLSRKHGESVVIGRTITVKVLKMRGNVVQLGFDAPKEIPIHRGELQRRIPGLDLPKVGAW